jgi:serine/threonine protein kinase
MKHLKFYQKELLIIFILIIGHLASFFMKLSSSRKEKKLTKRKTPFFDEDDSQTVFNIVKYKLVFPKEISSDFKSFLLMLLEYNPEKRAQNISKISKHPWVQDVDWKKAKKGDLESPVNMNEYSPEKKETKEIFEKDQLLDENEKKLFSELAKLCDYK